MDGRLTRGDVVIVTLEGEYGKTRPAVIVQTRALDDIPSVVIVPCTSELVPQCVYRPNVPANGDTGLKLPSQAMTDKVASVSLRCVKTRVGQVSSETLTDLTEALLFVIGAYDG